MAERIVRCEIVMDFTEHYFDLDEEDSITDDELIAKARVSFFDDIDQMAHHDPKGLDEYIQCRIVQESNN